MSDIQVFVVPPSGHTRPILVDPTSTTINDLRQGATFSALRGADVWETPILTNSEDETPTSPNWSPSAVRMSADGKPIYAENSTLYELGIVDGSVIRTSARLRGGASLKLRIKTKFGRKYQVTVNTIENVSQIFDAIAVENPKWAQKKVSGLLITKKGIALEADRKLLFYDLKDNEELWLELFPTLWFISDFRKTPRGMSEEDEEEEAEFQRAVTEAKEAKKKASEETEGTEKLRHSDSKEDIELGGR